MSAAAFYGLAGDFVRLVLPETEADPQALLVAFLVGFGCMVGRKPFYQVEDTRHGVNLFSVLVGDTSKARKGTATDRATKILSSIDPDFMENRRRSGLSSGEGLIQAVRDAREEDVQIKEKNASQRFERQIVDTGEADKRLLVIESEFASVLQQSGRDGNILSSVLRDAWDGKPLRVLARSNKDSCQEPHIAVLANITIEELQRLLTSTDKANGFGNRILWCCTRRSKNFHMVDGHSTTFAHSGGYALELGRGSKHSQVVANEFYDLGAGAIKVGDTSLHSNDSAQNYDNLIADNEIHDLGLVYAGSVGIWILQSSHNQIVHNEIHDIPYTGISVCWTWGYGANQSDGNIIAFNDIHDIGKDIMSDLGGIYTLGAQPHTIIRNNLIHHVSSHAYGGWGIYLDEGATGILVENNIVYECKSAGFHQHYGRENIMRNNIFALNHEHELMRTRQKIISHSHSKTTSSTSIRAMFLDRTGAAATSSFVIISTTTLAGSEIQFVNKSFDQWKAAGQDLGSLIADPRFKNINAYNFHLQPNSPATSMGFRQFDLSTLGPRNRAGAAYAVHAQ